MSIATQIANKKIWMLRGANNRIRREMKLAREAVESVAKGHAIGVVISGPPGCGKNRVVTEVLEREGYAFYPKRSRCTAKTANFVSPASNVGLIDELFKAKDGILLFDEADKTWNQSMINTHKKALDSDPANRVIVNNVKGRLKEGKARDHTNGKPFMSRARQIHLTNKNLGDPSQWPKHLKVHIDAIRSRIAIVTISDDLVAMWEYTCYLAICEGLLLKERHSLNVANSALSYMTETMFKFGEASPRRLKEIAHAIRVFPNSWRAHLDNRLPPSKAWGTGTIPAAPQIVPSAKPTPLLHTAALPITPFGQHAI